MLRHKGMTLLGLLCFAASLALAQGPPPPDFGAGLSPDQKTRLRSVMDGARKDTGELYGQLRAARKQLADLYDDYTLDSRKINETTRRINHVQNEILRRHLRTQIEMRRIVNPAQFEQLKRAMKAMRDRGGRERGGRERHRGPRPDDRG